MRTPRFARSRSPLPRAGAVLGLLAAATTTVAGCAHEPDEAFCEQAALVAPSGGESVRVQVQVQPSYVAPTPTVVYVRPIPPPPPVVQVIAPNPPVPVYLPPCPPVHVYLPPVT